MDKKTEQLNLREDFIAKQKHLDQQEQNQYRLQRLLDRQQRQLEQQQKKLHKQQQQLDQSKQRLEQEKVIRCDCINQVKRPTASTNNTTTVPLVLPQVTPTSTVITTCTPPTTLTTPSTSTTTVTTRISPSTTQSTYIPSKIDCPGPSHQQKTALKNVGLPDNVLQVVERSTALSGLAMDDLEIIVSRCKKNRPLMVGKLLKLIIGHDSLKNMTAYGVESTGRKPIPPRIYIDIQRECNLITERIFFLLCSKI